MKKTVRKQDNNHGRRLRRCAAALLALVGLWMAAVTAGFSPLPWIASVETAKPGTGALPLWQSLLLGDSALIAQWAAEGTAPADEPAPPEDAEEERELQAVTPDKVEERTISGSGAGYINSAGISLFNRTGKTVDLAAVAAAGTSLSFAPAEDGPQILIMHTHGTESFARTGTESYSETGVGRTTDTNYNVIKVGEEVARIFQEMGLSVVHLKELYDYPAYNGAYERSRAGIEAMLAQYPTIRMVLDIHRDALVDADGTVYKPVIQIDGVKTAQVMLLVGTDAAGAEFPDWTEHLALAMKLQEQMNSLWPGLARPITLRTARFNQQLTKGSLLVEVGSHGNTLEEALAGARLFARAAAPVLKSYGAAE